MLAHWKSRKLILASKGNMILLQWCGLVVFLEPTFEEVIVGGEKGLFVLPFFNVKSKSKEISGENLFIEIA